MTTHLPAPARETGGKAVAPTYEGLVEANVLRYATADLTELSTTRAPSARSRRLYGHARSWMIPSCALLPLAVPGFVATWVVAALNDGTAPQPLVVFTALAVLAFLCTSLPGSALVTLAAREETIEVPTVVLDAAKRLRSAEREVGQAVTDGTLPAEVLADLRLMRDSGEDLLRLLGDHQAAGTGHGPEASEARKQLFRIAAQADAYLTLHRLQNDQAGEAATHPAVETAQHLDLAAPTPKAALPGPAHDGNAEDILLPY